MVKIEKDAAKQLLQQYLYSLHPFITTDGRTTLTIFDDQTVDVGEGWVFTYRIYSVDEAIGAGRYFVEKVNGTIVAFGSIPSLDIQMAIYRAIHIPALGLPWPCLMSISLHLMHHFVINIVPTTTLCDQRVPQNIQPRGIADPPFDEEPCWACMAAIRSIGPFCSRCGNRLHTNEQEVCQTCSQV